MHKEPVDFIRRGRDSAWVGSLKRGFSTTKFVNFFNDGVSEFKSEHPAYAQKRLVFDSMRASEMVELFNAGVHMMSFDTKHASVVGLLLSTPTFPKLAGFHASGTFDSVH